MLSIAYYMLNTGHSYQELGGNYLEQINKDQLQQNFVKRLRRLGLQVTVEPGLEEARRTFSRKSRKESQK